jgi:ubiquitin-activating enzyme E1
VSCVEEERLGFEAGDMVVFSEVQGMSGLNLAPPARVRSKGTYSIEVELDSTSLGMYKTGE